MDLIFFLQICTMIFVIIFALLHFRLMPNFFCVFWFNFTLIPMMLTLYVVAFGIDVIVKPLLGQYQSGRLVGSSVQTLYSLHLAFNPHIRVTLTDRAKKLYPKIPPRTMVLIAPHASLFETFAFAATVPPCAHDIRTLYKESLSRIPILGRIMQCVGHFPVHFKDETSASFSVDAEKQRQTNEKMKKHVNEDKGHMSIFPEGQINKNPRELQAFRFGSLKFAFEEKMPIFLLALVGSERVWPAKKFGGLPADVLIDLRQASVDPSSSSSSEQAQMSIEEVEKSLRGEMQEMVASLYKQLD